MKKIINLSVIGMLIIGILPISLIIFLPTSIRVDPDLFQLVYLMWMTPLGISVFILNNTNNKWFKILAFGLIGFSIYLTIYMGVTIWILINTVELL